LAVLGLQEDNVEVLVGVFILVCSTLFKPCLYIALTAYSYIVNYFEISLQILFRFIFRN